MSSNTGSPQVSAIFIEAVKQSKNVVQRLFTEKAESTEWIGGLREVQTELLERSSVADQRQCSAGCSACCMTAQVDVTGIEAIVVAEYLQRTASVPQRNTIQSRLHKLTELRRGSLAKGELPKALACGMLGQDGRCQVYGVRPVICAGVFSLDQAACDRASENVKNGDISARIPLDQPAIQATGGISGGLQRQLVENGLDGNLYEFNSALLCVINEADLVERFLQREDLFEQAICTDAHSAPRRVVVPAPKFARRRKLKRSSA